MIGIIKNFIYHKSSVKPPRGLFERGDLFNVEETMVSVLHTELEYKVQKVNCKLVAVQPKIKNKSELLVGEKTNAPWISQPT